MLGASIIAVLIFEEIAMLIELILWKAALVDGVARHRKNAR